MPDKINYSAVNIHKELSKNEFIRKRPGMYLDGTDSKGIINLVKGLILDSNKELENEKNFFHFSILEENRFLLKIQSKNELSKLLKKSTDNRYVHRSKFHFEILEAISTDYEIKKTDETTVTLNWALDKDVIGSTKVDFINLTEILTQVAYLSRESEILITDNSCKYRNQIYMSFPEGIQYVYDRYKVQALGIPKFELSFDDVINNNRYQIFLGYRTDWFPSPTIVSFANELYTPCGGSLVDGIMEGLKLGCRDYVKKSNLKSYKIKKRKFDNGLILVCSVKGDNYKYGGSFKESLIDNNVKNESKKLIRDMTIKFIKNHKEKADAFLWRFDEEHLTSGIM